MKKNKIIPGHKRATNVKLDVAEEDGKHFVVCVFTDVEGKKVGDELRKGPYDSQELALKELNENVIPEFDKLFSRSTCRRN